MALYMEVQMQNIPNERQPFPEVNDSKKPKYLIRNDIHMAHKIRHNFVSLLIQFVYFWYFIC